MVVIKEISAKETYAIRVEILRKGSNLPVEFSGDFDTDTFHLGAFENNVLKGISSYMRTSNAFFETPQYQLRGMATVPSARGKGLAKQMLHVACKQLKEKRIPIIWCNAREVALGFYQSLGFLQEGKPFEIQQIGVHYRLYKKIQ